MQVIALSQEAAASPPTVDGTSTTKLVILLLAGQDDRLALELREGQRFKDFMKQGSRHQKLGQNKAEATLQVGI